MDHETAAQNNLAPKLAIAQASALVIFSSWALGGRYPGCAIIIIILAWLSLVPLVIYWNQREWNGIKKWLLCISPWLLLSLQVIISIFNPLNIPEASSDSLYITWQKNTPIPYFPICYEPARTKEFALIQLGCLATAATVFTVIRSRQQIYALLSIIALNGVTLAIIGSWFKLSKNPNVLGYFEPVNPHFFASFRYYNHWVAFALLSLGAAAAVAERQIQFFNKFDRQDRTRQRWDVVWVAIAAIIWIAIPLSGSRSGLLFATLFIIIASIRLAIAYRNRTSIFEDMERRTRKRLGIGILIGITLAGIIGPTLASDYLKAGIAKSRHQIESEQIDQRFYASPRDCWKMVQDKPVWGWGLGSYTYIFFKFAGPEYKHKLGAFILHNEHAHNDWMEYWVELGSVGYALLLSVPIGVIYLTFKRKRAYLECFWIALTIGLFLCFASFDFPLGPSAGIAIFCVCFAAGARLSLGPGKAPQNYYD
ncbi:O-antigen ligase family protein [Cerasicoccus frondis]|uniref:O-antigen ligase family protein n=1 Tax=Cerasicoccus frondis TaxID=490090 RepID=UPI002852C108|nr:O-antigen ligase family protein [Cerasicoccus frondis]